MKELIDKLRIEQDLKRAEWITLFKYHDYDTEEYVRACAEEVTKAVYKNAIYVRGLIEFTNICRNDCYYCGIRRSNKNINRYRLMLAEILECCQRAYEAGYRTFVLQGGEDTYYTDERMTTIIYAIRTTYPDCAITLSIGERSYESYEALYRAGADRYLLRHEAYETAHYEALHPEELSAKKRQECLYNLKKIGYQTGTGFMVGAPYQTAETLAGDMMFIKRLQPQMAGIGPYIPHLATPFKEMPAGTIRDTCFLLGLLRLMIPTLLLPSTTALGTLGKEGRLLGIKHGANVIMQNITPQEARIKYTLYENKERAGDIEIGLNSPFFKTLTAAGYQVVVGRGDVKDMC